VNGTTEAAAWKDSPQWRAVRSYLESPDAYDVLDDAVLGCLQLAVVDEVLSDYFDAPSRVEFKRFGVLLDEVLAEGF
jgi:hypothetical protein